MWSMGIASNVVTVTKAGPVSQRMTFLAANILSIEETGKQNICLLHVLEGAGKAVYRVSHTFDQLNGVIYKPKL